MNDVCVYINMFSMIPNNLNLKICIGESNMQAVSLVCKAKTLIICYRLSHDSFTPTNPFNRTNANAIGRISRDCIIYQSECIIFIMCLLYLISFRDCTRSPLS